MIMRKAWIVSVVLLLLGACAKQTNQPVNPHMTDQRDIGSFSELNIHGKVHVELKNASRGGKVVLHGDSRDLAQVKTQRVDDMLFLTVAKGFPKHGSIRATVYSGHFDAIRFNGKGSINGKGIQGSDMDMIFNSKGMVKLDGDFGVRRLVASNEANIQIKGLKSQQLEIIMNGKPKVKLHGMVRLKNLKYAGDGDLSMYWVDSDDLDIEGFGNAKVHLAGYVRYLNMNLHGKSEMDGQYLRVRKAYIKTFDFSIARLQPIRQLNTMAQDNSNIFYYSSPAFKADYMAENGAVLNFRPFWF